MDFTTMRQKHAEGAYPTWDALQADMRTMFANAMAFNPPETLYHKQVGARLAERWRQLALPTLALDTSQRGGGMRGDEAERLSARLSGGEPQCVRRRRRKRSWVWRTS